MEPHRTLVSEVTSVADWAGRGRQSASGESQHEWIKRYWQEN